MITEKTAEAIGNAACEDMIKPYIGRYETCHYHEVDCGNTMVVGICLFESEDVNKPDLIMTEEPPKYYVEVEVNRITGETCINHKALPE